MATASLFTPVGTLSYPHLDKPQASNKEGQKDKRSATFVFPKGTDLSTMEAAAREVAIEALGEKKGKTFSLYGGKGAAFRTDNADKYPKIKDAITVSARTDRTVGLVYRHADPATITAENPKGKPAKVAQEDIEEVFYPGAMVKGHVKPYWYNKEGNSGIGWALNNVQKWAEGERLDSRIAAEDAFDADMSETPEDISDLVS